MNTSFQVNFFILSCSHLLWWKSSITNFCSIVSKSTQKWKIVAFKFFSSIDNIRWVKVHDIITSYDIRIDQSNKFSKAVFIMVSTCMTKVAEKSLQFEMLQFLLDRFKYQWLLCHLAASPIVTIPKSWLSFSKQRTLLPTIDPHEFKVKITRINGAESP